MSNCFERMVPRSFSFSASVSLPEVDGRQSVTSAVSFNGGDINTLFGQRDRVCRNRLLDKYYQSIADGEPCLIKQSNYSRQTLPPLYPYPRVRYGTGYRYPERVEFGSDQTTLVVRYLASPISEEIAWPTTLPSLLVSRTGSPQVEIIDPAAYTNQTIYARLEMLDGAKTITNFLPTYLGSGAILYPSAPNDPNPADSTIPRLFPSKSAFNETANISQNGSDDVDCSGCGLCDFEFINLPEDQWSWTFTAGSDSSSGTGFNQGLLFGNYYQTPIEELNFSPVFAVQNVNLNSHSRACATTSQALTIGLETQCDLPDPPYSPCYWTQWLTFVFEDFKLGTNTATANYYGSTATATISISLA